MDAMARSLGVDCNVVLSRRLTEKNVVVRGTGMVVRGKKLLNGVFGGASAGKSGDAAVVEWLRQEVERGTDESAGGKRGSRRCSGG